MSQTNPRSTRRHSRLFGALCFFLAAVVFPSAGAQAEHLPRRTISAQQALHHGLRRAWVTWVQIDPSRDELAGATVDSPFVPPADESASSDEEINAALSIKPAEKPGDQETAAPAEPIDQGYVFLLSRRSQLEAIDLQSGRSMWNRSVGNRDYPSAGPAVSRQVVPRFGDRLVAVVNGSTLFMFKRTTGELAWSEELPRAAGASPTIGDPWVYVPLVTGGVAAFALDFDPHDVRSATMLSSDGAVAVPPTANDHSIGWGTLKGYVYGFALGSNELRFRFDAEQPILAPLAYWKGRFIVAAKKQYVYALDETSGRPRWRFTSDGLHVQAPFIAHNSVYLTILRGGIYRLSTDWGREQWSAPRVKQVLAASPTRLYTTDGLGHLIIINPENGTTISTLAAPGINWWYTNPLNDRILLGTRRGMLMCLHEPALENPVPTAISTAASGKSDDAANQNNAAPAADAAGEAKTKPAADDEPPAEDDDPFGR